MANTLPCANGGGSLNNPANPNTTPPPPYVAPDLCKGQWEITTLTPDQCAINDQIRQESYVAESLNISGAPINIYKLLGVHEQGVGSVLSSGNVIGSQSYPGYPLSNINTAGSWRSLQTGPTLTTSNVYVGVDFGIKKLPTGESEYKPTKPKWTNVGSINITQANTPNEFARQVKVEIADGECEYRTPIFSGVGNGLLAVNLLGMSATQSVITAVASSPTTFSVYASNPDGTVDNLSSATVGVAFSSPVINFTIFNGSTPFSIGDMFSVKIDYVWKRVGLFNLIQSPTPQTLNLQTVRLAKAIRVTPTLFSGTGSWEVLALDVLDSVPTDINNIQDLFFNENRDRDYAIEPVMMKVQYNPTDSISDLAKFGLSILDQYAFTASFATMVQTLGRPIVAGDIIEVTPEVQWDQNLKPIRKFLEVTDTGWASEGFSTGFKPTLYRFAASPALPSQETRDIFGTMDTQKYLIADSVLTGAATGYEPPLDTTPLTQLEEIIKNASNKVPETGSDEGRNVIVPIPSSAPQANAKGNVTIEAVKPKPSIYIEDGLPPGGEPYGEGFKLPEPGTNLDGDYFRLYYPPESQIAPRLYRFSSVKNRWIFLEQDRRGQYSSHKPSVRSILESNTKQGLGKKS
jgi:hypothetical protein